MKVITTIVFILFSSIFLIGQDHDHLYFLETDTSWRQELFIFPINFAQDIEYRGVEDARFPVGWEDQDSPNFWSYAFAWNLDQSGDLTAGDLEVNLQKYFNGLMRYEETSVQITTKIETDSTASYSGMIKTQDAFFTKMPMTLYVTIDKVYCAERDKSVLLFKFSPQEFGAEAWKNLNTVRLPESIANCEDTKAYKIHELVNACSEYGQFNGSVLVAEQGKLLYKNGFGEANKEWNIPNQANTKHRLASITKQFTAMAVLQLVAKGQLQLDQPITAYLKDYPSATGDQITIHHLLTHTSGIPNFTSFDDYQQIMGKRHTPQQLMDRFVDLPLEFTPGEKFAYSNSAYILLGIIIEQITGQTYAEVLEDNIFSPLHMNDTGYDQSNKILSNRADGYYKIANTYEKAQYIHMSTPYSAGALYSTAEDLYLWDRALYTEQLLPKEYRDLLFEPHVSAWGQYYGYGWEIANMHIGHTRDQIKTIGHSGTINGFNTNITRIPSEQSLIVILNNTGGAPLRDMTTAIIGILHDKPYIMPKRSTAFTLLDKVQTEGIDSALAFYEEIKASDEYYLNENDMNTSGYQLMQAGLINDAAKLFKLNVEAFPNSFNTYDSYGEALMAAGDSTLAIQNYKKSIQLNPNNENGIAVLEALGIDTESIAIKVPVKHLQMLAGEYKANDDNRDWTIVIEESEGKLYGNDSGYRYLLNPIGSDQYINVDDGASVVFDTTDESAISFVIFGRILFKKIK